MAVMRDEYGFVIGNKEQFEEHFIAISLFAFNTLTGKLYVDDKRVLKNKDWDARAIENKIIKDIILEDNNVNIEDVNVVIKEIG